LKLCLCLCETPALSDRCFSGALEIFGYYILLLPPSLAHARNTGKIGYRLTNNIDVYSQCTLYL